jgi:hydrogenase expression/formation protein HypC
MCLGVPGKVVAITRHEVGMQMGRVQFGGIQKEVCLSFLPEIQVGEYVIVHAGFAISQIDEEEAAKTFEILKQMGDLSAELAGEDVDAVPKAGADAVR